ncbi:aldo/keto reductase [Schaalia cardiffensis]
MDFRQCGSSGLRVSDLGLGTLTWGRDTEAAEAVDMLARFADEGGSFIECGPLDGDGRALDVCAEAIRPLGRHRFVLALRGGARRLPDGSWASSGARGDMLRSFDDALARLEVDDVDLWLASYDPSIPVEETLGAVETAYRSGRARYIGLAGFGLWDAARALTLLQALHGIPLAALHVPFSILTASESLELRKRVTDAGIGVIAASPLAGGVLTGKYRHSTPPDSRAASARMRALVDPFLDAENRAITEGVVRAAEGLDRTPLDVALTWAKDAPGVTTALIGPRTSRQLEQILEGGAPLPQPIRKVLDEIAGL